MVDKLRSDEMRDAFLADNRRVQEELRASYGKRQQVTLVPYEEAVAKKFETDWSTVEIAVPENLGLRVIADQPLEELVPYIDWSPFFMTWELIGKYPKILQDEVVGEAARVLHRHGRVERAGRREAHEGRDVHAREHVGRRGRLELEAEARQPPPRLRPGERKLRR